MWLPSDHYVAFVCFLDGLDMGSDGRLLDGFGSWLANGRQTSWAWWGHIERSVTGRDDGPGTESDMVRRLTPDVSAACVSALFDSLDQFLSQGET